MQPRAGTPSVQMAPAARERRPPVGTAARRAAAAQTPTVGMTPFSARTRQEQDGARQRAPTGRTDRRSPTGIARERETSADDAASPNTRRSSPSHLDSRPREQGTPKTSELGTVSQPDGASGCRHRSSGKRAEIAVGRDQLAPMFDGQRRQVCVRHERPLNLPAQPDENVPMPPAGSDHDCTRPRHQLLTEPDGGVHRGRGIEDSPVRHDPQKAGEHDFGQRERSGTKRSVRSASQRIARVPGRPRGARRSGR